MQRLHLLCNAHLDPCWLWEWEEGAAEAVSTFRKAADFCEEFEGFIFNHNEVILYRWIEEYEPDLFARIQRLVAEGKWRIMGGWYLQPDCNMPSGESFARQALVGKTWFLEKFGVEPRTAINFDPFGHTRGLVQILKKAGYDSYIHCRPDQNDCPLPDSDYIWVGYDGSEINGHRTRGWYGTPQYGKAREKAETYLKDNRDREVGLVLWGVGNHGGGPSYGDIGDIHALMEEENDLPVVHSFAEAYFDELRASGRELPRHEKDLNAWAPGCYTSQVRLKQQHRLLENQLYMLEKMAAHAVAQGLMDWPREDLTEALRDLLVIEFHDILPGSSIQAVEEMGLRMMNHALEKLSRLRAKTFFALASGQPAAPEGQIPVLAYNPHPFPVSGIFECEFNRHEVNFDGPFTTPVVTRDGQALPSQTEWENSNTNIDWRKRVVFRAELAPAGMSRFDCLMDQTVPERPVASFISEDGSFRLTSDRMEAVINGKTGLLDKYAVDGVDYLRPDAMRALVIRDNEDPWGMSVQSFRDVEGAFELLSPEKGTAVSGLHGEAVPSVRVIEDGEVRAVVEAVFGYADSFLVLRYKLPKAGTELEIDVRVHWNEKDRMLKLALPTPFEEGVYMGQVAYGRDELPGAEKEVVAQQWTAAISADRRHALTCINDGIYGSDFPDGEIRMSLLRSAAYSAHPFMERPLVPQDRYRPRMEQGERRYRFWVSGGPAEERLDTVDREALARNQAPFLLSFFPSGHGEKPQPGPSLSDAVVQMPVFKQAEDGCSWIIRLFEPAGQARKTVLRIPALSVEKEISLAPFELKTFRITGAGAMEECDLLERPLA
jgi:alpha-mannosidase